MGAERTGSVARQRSRPAGPAAGPPTSGPTGSLLQVQATAGNTAARALVARHVAAGAARRGGVPPPAASVQRQAGDPDDPSSGALTDPRWVGDTRFQAAFHNSPPIRPTDEVAAVAKLQQALVDAGMPMPVTMRAGTPDGRWGNETTEAVRRFQGDHGVRPVGGFEAGHKTLGALDNFLSGRRAPGKTQPTLDALATVGPGAFAGHVASGILDADIALILAAMGREQGTFMQDVAQMTLLDLNSGALAGFVKAGDQAKLMSRVPAADQPTLTAAPDPGGGAGYTAISSASVKGFALAGSSLLPSRTAPLRFPFLVIAHELSHHRVRDQANRIEKDPAGAVDNPRQYADLALAQKFAPAVVHTRKQFAVELQARHVAWHVAQEYDLRTGLAPTGRAMPAPGALFAACLAFARADPGGYHDNGYMAALAAKGDAAIGEQVAMWMTICAQMDFLNTAVASDVIGNFFIAEAALAKSGGFLPAVPADGLA